MGCFASKNQASQTQAPPNLNRSLSGKRLSVAENTLAPALITNSAITRKTAETELGTGSVLCGDDLVAIMDKLFPRQNRRGSVVIESINEDKPAESFKDKVADIAGQTSALDSSLIAYTCRKGLKPTAPNQDSYCILASPDFSVFGVFDGHGVDGHLISNFVKDSLLKTILRDTDLSDAKHREGLLKRAFIKTQQMVMEASKEGRFKADLAGTTVTLVLHDAIASALHVAQVGDSSCCLGKWVSVDGAPQAVSGAKIIEDHKPSDPDEKRRIEASGGAVIHDGYANHRVYAKGKPYPGMAMSRALGDLLGHKEAGIIAEPTVREVQLTDEDQMILLCSDGVWEFIQPTEAVEIVTAKPGLQDGIDALVTVAWDRWMEAEKGACVDDITAVCMLMKGGYGGSEGSKSAGAQVGEICL